MELKKINVRGVEYQQLTRKQAMEFYKTQQIFCLPNKMNPQGMFTQMLLMPQNEDFENMENHIKYYNCCQPTGDYLHFYIELENETVKSITFSSIAFMGTCKQFNSIITQTDFSKTYAIKKNICPSTVYVLNGVIIIKRKENEFCLIDIVNGMSRMLEF